MNCPSRFLRPTRIVLLAVALATTCVLGSFQAAPAADNPVPTDRFSGGVAVVVGANNATLAITIGRDEAWTVQLLVRDADQLTATREAIQTEGLQGRVSVEQWGGERLPYTENLINVLVVETPASELTTEEIDRVLTPLGVVLFRDDPAGKTQVERLRAEGWEVVERPASSETSWLSASKPWPTEIDEWTHFLHGPDGNAVSQDTVVGPPRRYQWLAGPEWLRSHDSDASISAIVTARGRLFYIVDEAPISLPGQHPLPDKWFLAARDAFNGRLLWKIPIDQWGWRQWKETWFLCRPGDMPLNLEMRLVAAGDRLFVTLGYRAPVSVLDARTGQTLATLEGTEGTREILHHDGTLLLTVPTGDEDRSARIVAVDSHTGKRLWQTEEPLHGTTSDYIRWKSMVGQVKAPVLDPALNLVTDGRTVAVIDGTDIAAFDFATGKPQWRTTIPNESEALWMGATIVSDGVVLYGSRTQLVALDALRGNVLWSQPKTFLGHLWYEWKEVFVIDGLAWTYSAEIDRAQFGRGRNVWPTSVNGYDLKTGEKKKQVDLGPIFKTHHHHRCYRAKATVRYILASRRGTEYIDLAGGTHTVDNWVRGTCHFGQMPANGLHYAPPHPCRCYILEKLNGFNALAPESRHLAPRDEVSSRGARGLLKGPAFDTPPTDSAMPEDWPTLRHDAFRSGGSPTAPSDRIEPAWTVRVAEKLSAPVVVGDQIFVAAIDRHQVIARSTEDGSLLWRFTAGARVDSPPTYWQGRVLFGSTDGCVYCLRASDGQFAWRFQAAPVERRIGVHDQLESAWPVHGSVLVLDGTVYFAAGRSSHLDGGIGMFALDARSGRVLHHQQLEGPRHTSENIETNYELPEGILSDVLMADGESILMRGRRFDRRLKLQPAPATQGARGGILDDTYFQRAHWYFGQPSNFARVFVTDADRVYQVRMFPRIRGLDPEHYFTPASTGYEVSARERLGLKVAWSKHIPTRVRSLLLAGNRLLAAGPPDVIDPDDPLGAFEGRRGATLWVFDAEAGQVLGKIPLDSPPIFNGLAIAAGRLYMTTEAGTLVAFEPPGRSG